MEAKKALQAKKNSNTSKNLNRKNLLKTTWGEWLGITVGAVITAFGLDLFLIPNKIAAGGVSGFSTIVYYYFHIPVGVTMLVIEAPLVAMAWRRWGFATILRSAYGAILLAVVLLFLEELHLKAWTSETILAAIYGGILCGLGMGIVFRSGGTTGGTDLMARLLQQTTGTSVGKTLLMVDGAVVTLAAFAFELEVALYAMITIFMTTKMIDFIQEGIAYSKAVLIISEKNGLIGDAIITELQRGVTVFPCSGLYKKQEKQAVLCVVSQSEINRLKKLVNALDEAAFIIVSNTNEVLGNGFKCLQEKRP